MRRFSVLPLALVIVSLTGCEETPRDQLKGSWLGERIEHVDPSQAEAANGWVRGARFDFESSRVTVSIPAETPRSGKYEISRLDDKRMTLTFTRPEGGRDVAEFELEGKDRLRWDLGDGRQVYFRKVPN